METKQIDKLAILTVGFSWLSWLSIFNAFFWDERHSWFLPILIFVVSFSFWCLYIFLEVSKKRSLIILVVSNLPAVFLFRKDFNLLLFGLVFGFLFYYLAILNIFEEKKERTKIRVFRSLKIGFRYLILGFSVILSLGVFSLLSNDQISYISTPKIEIKTENLQFALSKSKNLVKEPSTQKDLSLLVDNVTLMEFVEKSSVFEEENEYIENNTEYKDIFLEKLASQLEVKKLTGDEKVLSLLSNFLNQKINKFLGLKEDNQEKTMPYLIAVVVLFFVINSLSWLLGIFVKGLANLWFYLLVRIKFLKVNKKSKEIEEIAFD